GSRRGQGFCREGRRCARRRDDGGDATADQLSRQFRQSTELIFGPAVFDRDVAAFDKACFVQASLERGDLIASRCEGADVKIANYRHRRLLRARRERPSRRAADEGYKLAPSHGSSLVSVDYTLPHR